MPEQVAEVIVQEALNPSRRLRVQTSELAQIFANKKLAADPDGTKLQSRIRNQLLGLH